MSAIHEQILKEWRESGLTQKGFCESKGISFGQFVYARQQETKKNNLNSSSNFSKVKIEKEIPFSVVFPSGARIEFTSLSTSELKQLLQ